MKKIIIAFLLCSGICSATNGESAPKPHLVLEYRTPIEFATDFFNSEIKSEKTLMYWATQLALLLQKEPHLKPFCVELIGAARTRNASRIQLLFIQYQDKFSGEVQTYIKSIGLKKVKAALEKRAEK